MSKVVHSSSEHPDAELLLCSTEALRSLLQPQETEQGPGSGDAKRQAAAGGVGFGDRASVLGLLQPSFKKITVLFLS